MRVVDLVGRVACAGRSSSSSMARGMTSPDGVGVSAVGHLRDEASLAKDARGQAVRFRCEHDHCITREASAGMRPRSRSVHRASYLR